MARSAAKGHCDRVLRYVAGPPIFMERGWCRVLGRLEAFSAEIYYTSEQLADLAILGADPPPDPPGRAWLDWVSPSLRATARVYVPGMPSLAIPTAEVLDALLYGVNWGEQSGKTQLLWEVLAGARDLKKADYDGPLLP